MQAVPVFLSEMGPPQYRGALNNMFQLATSCGILIAQLVNFGVKDVGPFQWRVLPGCCRCVIADPGMRALQNLIAFGMPLCAATNYTACSSRGG